MQSKNIMINKFVAYIQIFKADLKLWRNMVEINNLVKFPNIVIY